MQRGEGQKASSAGPIDRDYCQCCVDYGVISIPTIHSFGPDYVNSTRHRHIFCAPALSLFGPVDTTSRCTVGTTPTQEYSLEAADASFHKDDPGTRSPTRSSELRS